MECPNCSAELEQHDTFGRLASHQDGAVMGYVYKCPNGEEQDGSCDSELHCVAGSFYTYKAENENTLHEGYPC